ncbi:hypothetical protein LB505_001104 [Fusarium chuoi]|nr:hypothetical protein LB505_001104 [Fusarium chuoi]
MRVATVASFLASASLAIAFDWQQVLGDYDQKPSSDAIASNDDAPSYRTELLSLHKSLVETSSVSGTEYDDILRRRDIRLRVRKLSLLIIRRKESLGSMCWLGDRTERRLSIPRSV